MTRLDRLYDIQSLADGWYDGEGFAVTHEALMTAKTFLAEPAIFPRLCGGIEIDFGDHIIDIDPDGIVTVW